MHTPHCQWRVVIDSSGNSGTSGCVLLAVQPWQMMAWRGGESGDPVVGRCRRGCRCGTVAHSVEYSNGM